MYGTSMALVRICPDDPVIAETCRQHSFVVVVTPLEGDCCNHRQGMPLRKFACLFLRSKRRLRPGSSTPFEHANPAVSHARIRCFFQGPVARSANLILRNAG